MDFLIVLSVSLFLIGIGILVLFKAVECLDNWLLKSNFNLRKSKDEALYKEANPIWRDK